MSDLSDSESLDSFEQDLVGEILHKKYLLITPIGKGTFATVWLAMTIDNYQFYAIKIQNWEDYDNGIDEVKILKKFKKNNEKYINTIIDHFEYEVDDGICICMVFELLVGSVYDIMKSEKYQAGLPYNIVMSITFQLLTAMQKINEKYHIIHTDIKPENILIVGKNKKYDEICQKVKNNNELIKTLKKNKNNAKHIKEIVCNMDFTDIKEKYTVDNLYEFDHNVHIKLSDFGNYKNIDHQEYDIQTRYYRAPEIILGYPYNSSCDLWSVGCLIYELLTGNTLFDPDKDKRVSRDRYHLHNMICTLGKIPDYLVEKSKYKSLFYKKNGLLKGFDSVQYIGLNKMVHNELLSKLTEEQIIKTTELLSNMLLYDPYKRLSIKQIFLHQCQFFHTIDHPVV